MRVVDLEKVTELDQTIQDLLDQLTSLYKSRVELMDASTAKRQSSSRRKRTSRSRLDSIDLSGIDLSLK